MRTTAGFRITAGAIPSSLVAGDLGFSAAGIHWSFDGTNISYHSYFAGSETTPPTAITGGQVPGGWSEVAMVLDSSRRAGKSKMKVARTVRSYLTLFLDRGRWVRQASKYLGRPIEGLDEIVTRR